MPEVSVNRTAVDAVTESIPKLPDNTTQINESNTESYVVTAYTAGYESTQKHPGEIGYGITASGERVKAGVTAACPRELPFGTKLRIDGVGERICQDRGNSIKGMRLDVYFTTVREAIQFGRKTLDVTIIKESDTR